MAELYKYLKDSNYDVFGDNILEQEKEIDIQFELMKDGGHDEFHFDTKKVRKK